jgi:DNA-binding NarL/FixJ family response regulator
MIDTPRVLRIALVDDHTLFRQGLSELLAVEPDLDIVGQAGDSVAAVQMIASHRPDTVLLDVEMPHHPVGVTIEGIRRASPETRILILTMHDDPLLLQEVLAAGAYGLLVKTATRDELVGAIRAVGYYGKTVLSVSHSTVAELAAAPRNPLSPRELDVLKLASRAMSNAQIANSLYIAQGTVKRHLTNIYAKLGAVSRLDAVNKAVAAHLIRPPDTGGEIL